MSAASDNPLHSNVIVDPEEERRAEVQFRYWEEKMKRIHLLIPKLQLNSLPGYASKLRQASSQNTNDNKRENFEPITLGSPIYRRAYFLIDVHFNDDVEWILKVPTNTSCHLFDEGTDWLSNIPTDGSCDVFDQCSVRALRNEALTMELLRRKTTIPVPEVFAFDDTCNNVLGWPFILTRVIPGKKLSDYQSDQTILKNIRKESQMRLLKDLAAAVMQLDKFSFDQGGSIDFDERGQPVGIGPYRSCHSNSHPKEAIYCEEDPVTNPESYYSKLVSESKPDGLSWYAIDGMNKIRELFIQRFRESSPEPEDERKKFVLVHPDLNTNNVIISDDGALQGLTGWGYAYTVPRSLGNQSYPMWLMKETRHESPETLRLYCTVWEDLVTQYRPQNEELTLNINRTRNSLLATVLRAASPNDPWDQEQWMCGLLRQIEKVVGSNTLLREEAIEADFGHPDERYRSYRYLFDAIENGCPNERHMEFLKTGFDALQMRIMETQDLEPRE